MNSVVNRFEPFVSYARRMNFGERLQHALDASGLTAAQLIAALRVPKGTIYNILNDTSQEGRVWGATTRAICKKLRISVEWFLLGDGQMRPLAASNDDDEFPPVMGYAHGAGMGEGRVAEEYAETFKLKFRAESLRKKGLDPDKLKVYYGDGDSMEPTIEHGDAIMFNTAETEPKDDGIFILETNDGTIAKRLRLFGDRWFVVSDNPHDTKWRNPVPLDDKRRGFHIVGRVRWIARWKD